MNEKDLNIEYICEKTLLNKDDKLVPIILDLIQESYKAGLCQTEFDNTMNLIEENQELKKQLEVGNKQYCDLVEEKEILQEQLSIKTLQLEELKDDGEAKIIKDYLVDVVDGVYGNTLGDNKENYFDKLTKERD